MHCHHLVDLFFSFPGTSCLKLCNDLNLLCLNFFTELKAFLENLKEQWSNKQKEVEATLEELTEDSTDQAPLPKKRKRGKNTEPKEQLSDPFAKYAAELQIEMFTKVS